MSRKRKKKHNGPVCPYCNTPAKLVDTAEIYHGRSYGWAWKCPKCPDAYVGCHRGTTTPLGRIADSRLRQAKMAVHRVFDPLWQDGGLTRSEAYVWLTQVMELDKPAHIGEFDVDQCLQAIALCSALPETPTIDYTAQAPLREPNVDPLAERPRRAIHRRNRPNC
jgi:ribosomal protein L37AE/L43A